MKQLDVYLGNIKKIFKAKDERVKELENIMQRAYPYIPKGSSLQKDFEKSLKG